MGDSIAKSSTAPPFIDLVSAEGQRELLAHLDGAKLSLTVDLAPGTHELPLRSATLTVRRDTKLSLALSIVRDGEGRLTLGPSSATLTRPVKVERGLGAVLPFFGAIADLLFDLHLQGFCFQPGRPLELEGGLRCGFLELKPPGWLLGKLKSRIEQRVRSLLTGGARALALPEQKGPRPAGASAADVVRLLTQLVEHAEWSVDVDLQALSAGGKAAFGEVQWLLSDRRVTVSGTVLSEPAGGLRVELEHGGAEQLSAAGHVVVSAHGPAVAGRAARDGDAARRRADAVERSAGHAAGGGRARRSDRHSAAGGTGHRHHNTAGTGAGDD